MGKQNKRHLSKGEKDRGRKAIEYSRIELWLVERLPEIRPAAEIYWQREGRPGDDSGPYIFVESMLATYIEILLMMRPSASRARLLLRAFSVVDDMLQSYEANVRDLAFIGVLEGRETWWLKQAATFMGTVAKTELDSYRPQWRDEIAADGFSSASEVLDLYGARTSVAAELGLRIEDVPGRTY